MKKPLLVTILLLMTMTTVCPIQAQTAQSFDERLAVFELVLEEMRQELKIPGMSVALIKDRELVWAKGFGYADLENKVEATEYTTYYIASLTKTFASTILMQLVEQGKLDLDDPVSKYGVQIKTPGTIRVRHLFSHTSEGMPGSFYNYNGDRFYHLGRVVKVASGRSFDDLPMENIVRPLSMNDTVPENMREEAEFSHIMRAHSVGSTSRMRLLDAVEFPRAKPSIIQWEFVSLIVFLSCLASPVVFLPTRLLYKRLVGQKERFDENSKFLRNWRPAVAWIACINGVICLTHMLPLLLGGRLEGLVADGMSMLAEAQLTVWASLPLASACMVTLLIVAVVLSWWKKFWKKPLRVYYTLVVAAATGYLMLLNHLRLIVLPA
jgi:hypothetical protein